MKRILLVGLALACVARPAFATDANETMALMMAVATFNTKNCPAAKPNEEFIAKTFNEFGVNSDNMVREPYRSSILQTLTAFESKPAYFCESTWTMFGTNGTAIPGLLLPRR